MGARGGKSPKDLEVFFSERKQLTSIKHTSKTVDHFFLENIYIDDLEGSRMPGLPGMKRLRERKEIPRVC